MYASLCSGQTISPTSSGGRCLLSTVSTPAPKNLQVPPYHFVNDSTIQIGVDPKEAG